MKTIFIIIGLMVSGLSGCYVAPYGSQEDGYRRDGGHREDGDRRDHDGRDGGRGEEHGDRDGYR
jgi:hypothetical protein